MRDYLTAFIDSSQQGLNGTITVRLHRGVATTVARQSPVSLYRPELVTYGAGNTFPSEASVGFIEIASLAGTQWREVRGATRGSAEVLPSTAAPVASEPVKEQAS